MKHCWDVSLDDLREQSSFHEDQLALMLVSFWSQMLGIKSVSPQSFFFQTILPTRVKHPLTRFRLLYMVVFYLVIRYGLGPHLMTGADFAIGTTVGVVTVGAFLTVGPTVLFPRLTLRPLNSVPISFEYFLAQAEKWAEALPKKPRRPSR